MSKNPNLVMRDEIMQLRAINADLLRTLQDVVDQQFVITTHAATRIRTAIARAKP